MIQLRFPYTKQSIDQNDLDATMIALQQPMITRAEKVKEFEKLLCETCGAKYAVVFNSGSSALHASYSAMDLRQNDHIFTTPITFIATINQPLQKNLAIEFLEVESNGNLSIEDALEKMNPRRTNGRNVFVPVHFSGNPIDMQAFDRKIKDPNLVVIEDAAHALGATYPSGEKVGSCAYSDLTIFSFHPAKTITTGEGGAVMTNDESLANRLRLYRNNGLVRTNNWDYDVQFATGNFHLTDFQAALGISQLKKLDSFIKKRRELVQHYRQQRVEGIDFADIDSSLSACHLHVGLLDDEIDKAALQKDLRKQGIGTQIHYKPLYLHSVCKNATVKSADIFYRKSLSLPLYFDLELEDVDWICEKLNHSIAKQKKVLAR